MNTKGNLVHPTPIAELQPMRPAMVQGVVVRFGPVEERFSRDRFRPIRKVTIRDTSGEIPLTLWGDEVGHVRDADRVLLVEVWVKDYQGRPELVLGTRGYVVNLGPASGRGPVLKPDPKGGRYVWGLVRRRLREKDLRKGHEEPVPPAQPVAAPTPTPRSSMLTPLALAAMREDSPHVA